VRLGVLPWVLLLRRWWGLLLLLLTAVLQLALLLPVHDSAWSNGNVGSKVSHRVGACKESSVA
jgi:hypothetical protein